MSSVVFSGGRLESVRVLTGAPSDSTSSGSFDPAYCDASLLLLNSIPDSVSCDFVDSSFAPTAIADGSVCWVHFDGYLLGGGPNGFSDAAVLYDSSGHPWVKMEGDRSIKIALFANTGTGVSPVWTQLGINVPIIRALITFDISIAINSTGLHKAAVYWNGVATAAAGTFTNVGFTNLASMILKPFDNDSSGGWGYSQILVTDGLSTIKAHVATIRATGAGANSGWSGTYTDVNEPADNDSTFNQATSVGLKQSYVMGDVTVAAGYHIESVFYWLRANNASASPENVKALCRQGGVDYLGAADMVGIGPGLSSVGWRFDVDPSTSAAWTQTTFNSIELGYESET